jgi:hypothetical protein
MKRIKKKQFKMRSWVKIHAACTVFLLVLYVGLGLFGGFSMLGNDLKSKYALAVGTTISVFIDGLPGVPVVTAPTSCVLGVSTVDLSWIGSEGATSYTITRNGLTLVSGISSMMYTDNTVYDGYAYEYTVTAYGASGSNVSDPLTITSADCGNTHLPDPNVVISVLGGETVVANQTTETTQTLFKITGTTNMANAHIKIATLPGPIFVSTLEANAAGYWEYYLPSALGLGSYTFQVTATDFGIPTRNVTKDFRFTIIEKQGDSNNNKKKKNHSAASTTTVTTTSNNGGTTGTQEGANNNQTGNTTTETLPEVTTEQTGIISIELKNKSGKVYRGQDVQMLLIFNQMGQAFEGSNVNLLNLKYEIIDQKGGVVFSGDVAERVYNGQLEKNIHIPEQLANGDYTLRISMQKNGTFLSGESHFTFGDMPVINFGGGIKMTYSELISEIGWIAASSITVLIFFGFMFLMEFYIFKKSLLTIAEDGLIRSGMISTRKGVQQ